MSESVNKKIIGVIPARWASSRFPGKPLAPILGRPLLHWVVENAKRSRLLSDVIVATDDDRVRLCAEEAGAECFMTRADHESGTDRVAEVAAAIGPDAVINIQGDEPMVDPALIDRLCGVLLREVSEWDMVTAAVRIFDGADIADANIVKVVTGAFGQALYFSRAPIPYNRDAVAGVAYWQHLGVYGYTAEFLRKFVEHPPCELENIEKLEQLRALSIGCRMKVIDAERSSIGVDVPADIDRVETILRSVCGEKGETDE